MAVTVKEIHVEVEQRIQQITSNRRRSIAPEFIDMCLNTTARAIIDEKLSSKANAKREGFEESKERTDELRSLKRELTQQVIVTDGFRKGGYIDLPSDYYRIISSNSEVSYSKLDKASLTKTKSVNGDITYIDIYTLLNNISASSTVVLQLYGGITIDLTEATKLYQKGKDLFTVVNPILDLIRNDKNTTYKTNAYWEFYQGEYNKHKIVITSPFHIKPNVQVLVDGQSKPEYISLVEKEVTVTDVEWNRISENDLVSSETMVNVLNNTYSNSNRHLNPITTIKDNRLFVYFNDTFSVKNIELTYIKQPILFNIRTGQVSDFEVTADFIDRTVALILLTLKDGTYNNVQQFNQD